VEELMGIEAVADYLEVRPTTVQRWCREGRLPCLKLGKVWRIRRSALDDFLLRAERPRTLADDLRAFIVVPDYLVVVAEDEALLSRFDAAFFRVGEAHGGLLIKVTDGEARSVAELQTGLVANGLELDRLETEGRFRWHTEAVSRAERAAVPHGGIGEEMVAGRSVWVSVDWTKQVDLATVLRQQEALEELITAGPLVVKTAVLEAVVNTWSPAEQRRAQREPRGQIQLAHDGLLLSRSVPRREEVSPQRMP
jgi:excisionase family DNA binding protein